jgi:hypothetical protein
MGLNGPDFPDETLPALRFRRPLSPGHPLLLPRGHSAHIQPLPGFVDKALVLLGPLPLGDPAK